MFPRFSIVAAFFSVALPGIATQTTNADWYKVEIRSQKQTALKAAEAENSHFNVPQTVLFEDVQQTPSGKSKPFTFGVENSGKLWHSIEDSAETPKVIHTEQSELVTTIVRQRTTAIDEKVAADVERLLNQNENWYTPIHRASNELQSISFTDSGSVVESMNYLDELREMGEIRSPWIQPADIAVEQNYQLEVGINNDSKRLDTQPMFINDLEKLVTDNSLHLISSNGHLDEFVPPFMEDLEELHFNQQFPVQSVSTQMIAQIEPSKEYSPSSKTENNISLEKMNSLFPSVAEISIAGKSTAPPKESDIKKPTNLAPKYMDHLIPAQYTMGPIFGVAAPSRYPHCFTHGALYFEDPNLERCGVSYGYLTNARSAALFTCRTLAMPYLVLATPPRTCMVSLGDCTTCAEFGTDAYFREW